MLSRSLTVATCSSRAGLLLASLSFGLVTVGCSGAKEQAAPSAEAESTADANETSTSEPVTSEPLEEQLSESSTTDDLIAMIDAAGQKRGGGKEALQQVVDATTSQRSDVRWHAARAIGMIGEDAIAEIPVLIGLLSDDDAVVAAQAASAIRMIRIDDERENADLDEAATTQYTAATEALAAKIVHPDARVRRVVIGALSALQPPTDMIVPLVAKQLADEDPSVVIPALHTMADAGSASVPFLVESLAEPKSRYWASVVLAEIGTDASDAAPALMAIAKDTEGEPEERMQAILALAAIGDAAAGDSLAGLVESESGPVQFAAVYACGVLRTAAAADALETVAASDVPFLSGIATWGLARINPEDEARITAAFDKLLAGMQHENPAVRQASVTGLSDLEDELSDEQRSSLATALTTEIRDSVAGVREAAAAAILRLEADAVPALIALLAEEGESRLLGLELLAALGSNAAEGFAAVLDTLQGSDDPLVQADAAFALGAIARSEGSEASNVDAAAIEQAIGPITELVTSKDTPDEVRYTAVYALGKFGVPAAAAAEELQALAAGDDVLLATVSAWAGLRIDPGNKERYEQAIPLLEKALRSERELARLEAAVALGDMGADAADTLPLLELVSEDDPSRTVRAAAAAAVVKIGG
jgi:HEAT repeat protein